MYFDITASDFAFIFTDNVHAFIQTYATKSAHPELPWGIPFLASVAALSNGATTKMFPSSKSQLFLLHLDVNYAQTRKRGSHSILPSRERFSS